MDGYSEMYARSLTDPGGFRAEAAQAVQFCRPWAVTLDRTEPPLYRWFSGGITNTCYNALDRHVIAGRDEQPALVFDDPAGGEAETLSFRRLTSEAARLAGALRSLGVHSGDRVLITVPAIPALVIAMLGCARIGAIHAVFPSRLQPERLAAAIDAVAPTAVLTSDARARLDAALEQAISRPSRCMVLRTPDSGPLMTGRDVWWHEAVDDSAPAPCAALDPADPVYLLSVRAPGPGATRVVVREQGGHQVGLAWAMSQVYGLQGGDTVWTAADLYSAVGHSGIVYGPLLLGCTSILAPSGGRTADVAIVTPAIMPAAALPQAARIFLARAADEGTAPPASGRPIIEQWWQPEFSWPISSAIGSAPGPEGRAGTPLPGYRVRTVAADGTDTGTGRLGELVLDLPLPPGGPAAFRDQATGAFSPFPTDGGSYRTGAGGRIDPNGRVWVEGPAGEPESAAGRTLIAASAD